MRNPAALSPPLVPEEPAVASIVDGKGPILFRGGPIVAAVVGAVGGFAWCNGDAALAAAAAGVVVLYGCGLYWRARRMFASLPRLAALAEAGQLDVVVSELGRFARAAPERRARWEFANYLAYYELRRGNVDCALALLSSLYRRVSEGPEGPESLVRERLRSDLCLAYLAGGKVDEAARCSSESASFGRYAPWAAATLAARRAQWDAVLALEWPTDDSPIDLDRRRSRRTFHLMQSYARAQRGERDTAELTEALEAARPAFAREYDYLTGRWPGLRTFIDSVVPPPREAPAHAALPRASLVADSRAPRSPDPDQ